MTPERSSPEVSQTIGRLCVIGDRACTHGDLAGLRRVAQQLAEYAQEPIHCELAELAAQCNTDVERAVTLWDRLKPRLYCQSRT